MDNATATPTNTYLPCGCTILPWGAWYCAYEGQVYDSCQHDGDTPTDWDTEL